MDNALMEAILSWDMNTVNLSLKAKIEYFHKLHGEYIQVGEKLLFIDGAERDIQPFGILYHGPMDPYERAKRITHYHETKLKMAVAEFKQRQGNLLAFAKAGLREQVCPAPPVKQEEAVQELTQLREEVRLLQKNWEEAKAQQEKLIPEDRLQRQRRFDKNRADLERFASAIDEIKI